MRAAAACQEMFHVLGWVPLSPLAPCFVPGNQEHETRFKVCRPPSNADLSPLPRDRGLADRVLASSSSSSVIADPPPRVQIV